MRKVNRLSIAKPVELDSSDCRNHLNTVIAAPDINKISDDFYRGKKINPDKSEEFTVRDALKKLYKNKCAYCEKLSHAPSIDHHRPKNKVLGSDRLNLGYYWLGYEWSNLLPCCTDCNSITTKGSRYPILGTRNNKPPSIGNPAITDFTLFAYNSSFNNTENPLLLHPEYCNPKNHFKFDKQGKIIGKTQKGSETIKVLKLDNPDLNGWRRKIYNDHLAKLKNIIRKFFKPVNPITESQFEDFISDWVADLIDEAYNDALEYTLFRKFLLKEIEYFFILELDSIFQNITRIKITDSISKLSE